MIEIKSDSLLLALLMACSLPLMLTALIAVVVLSTRSRLREVRQIRKDLQEKPGKQYLDDKKLVLAPRIAAGCLSIFWLGMLIGFLIFIYRLFETAQIDNWILSLVIILFLSGIVAGVLILFVLYKRNKLNK